MKKFVILALCLCLIFSMTACAADPYKKQFEMPKKGDTIAILHTNHGDITVRFFKKEAPKAVENFITLAESGYYDGVTFHRVIKDFMIQAGDPTGTGSGGESAFGGTFANEIVDYLSTYRGSLCMANSGKDTNTSQFFIVTDEDTDATRIIKANEQVGKDKRISEEKVKNYQKYGGALWLDDQISTLLNELYGTNVSSHTVFGQVIDGMDVVDEISQVEVDSELEMTEANIDNPGQMSILKDKPKEDVIIESIEITTYNG